MSALTDFLWYLVEPIVRGLSPPSLSMIGVLFPIVPILFAWPRRRALPVSLRWALVYLVLALAEDLVMIYWSRNGQHNLWIMNLYTPIEAVLVGMMFSGWQLRERWRSTIYLAVAAYVAFWLLMVANVENLEEFSRYTKSVESLLVIAVAAWTLVQRSRHTAAPLTLHAWFWVSVGALFYFAYLLLLNPIGAILGEGRVDLLTVAYELNGALVLLMYLFWLRAFLLVRKPSKAGATP